MSPQHATSGRADLLLFALDSSPDLVDQALASILDVFGPLQCTQQLTSEHTHWDWQGQARQASAGVSSTVRWARFSNEAVRDRKVPQMPVAAQWWEPSISNGMRTGRPTCFALDRSECF